MNNLMKAEWYRLRNSGNLLLILVLVGICSVVMQFVGDNGIKVCAKSYYLSASIGMAIVVGSITGIVTATFNNRLANYEIMKGTPPMIMIFSKILISLIMVTVLYFIPSFVLLLICDGEKITLTMVLLTFVCILKLTLVSTAVCIIFKDAAGVTLFFIAFVFQSAPLVLLQNVVGINVVLLTPFITSTQLIIIGNLQTLDLENFTMPLNTSHFALKIIASFIIVAAVLLPVAHRSLKNKWEIKMVANN